MVGSECKVHACTYPVCMYIHMYVCNFLIYLTGELVGVWPMYIYQRMYIYPNIPKSNSYIYCITIVIRQYISSIIRKTRLCTSLTYVDTKPNDLWCVALHTNYLNNRQPFIHKLIYRYKLIIVCKTDIGIISLTLTWNAICKKTRNKILSSKIWWEPKTASEIY